MAKSNVSEDIFNNIKAAASMQKIDNTPQIKETPAKEERKPEKKENIPTQLFDEISLSFTPENKNPRRSYRATGYLTEEENEAFKKACTTIGLSTSQCIRELILSFSKSILKN